MNLHDTERHFERRSEHENNITKTAHPKEKKKKKKKKKEEKKEKERKREIKILHLVCFTVRLLCDYCFVA